MKYTIFDGNNLIARCLLPWTMVVSKNDRIPYAFLRTIRKAIVDFPADRFLFLRDISASKFRQEIFPEYKVKRKEVKNKNMEGKKAEFWKTYPRQQKACFTIVKEMLPMTLIEADGFEADDLAWLVCEIVADGTNELTFVSTDDDYIQLTKFPKVKIWNPWKKWREAPEKCDIAQIKALSGCKTDEIPGIKGVGEKTAIRMLKEANAAGADIEELLENTGNFEALDIYRRNIKLVDLSFVEFPTSLREEVTKLVLKDEPQFCEEKLKEYAVSQNMKQLLSTFEENFAPAWRDISF